MREQMILFLMSALFVAASITTIIVLFATNQERTMDGVFLSTAGLTWAAIFSFTARYIWRSMRSSRKAAASGPHPVEERRISSETPLEKSDKQVAA